jgi:hypothetical protein
MYDVKMVSCDMIHTPSFMKIGTGFQAILRFCLRNLRGLMLVLLMRGFMNYVVEMGSGEMTYISTFIMIG